jgi:hypothetical protein
VPSLGVVAQIVRKTIEPIEGNVRVGVNAEFNGSLAVRPAVSGALPRYGEVLAVNDRDVLGLLDDQASVQNSPKTRGVQ